MSFNALLYVVRLRLSFLLEKWNKNQSQELQHLQPREVYCSLSPLPNIHCRVLKGGVSKGEGVFLGNPEDSVWEDWGTLGKIRGITTRDP